jgi:hypothetical protein
VIVATGVGDGLGAAVGTGDGETVGVGLGDGETTGEGAGAGVPFLPPLAAKAPDEETKKQTPIAIVLDQPIQHPLMERLSRPATFPPESPNPAAFNKVNTGS